ncbi:MAG: imidazole glycerol phosphate synthase subunit HisH, partial [Verrucomicrobiae bacterium]|nr:imidazole glycerol phosphate synthase subunit HisH [Verrucomicrobiae bacterium]
VLQEKKSFLGICLGMQLVAKRGFEGGEHEGLGWLDAEVVPLRPSDPRHRIPHMGWNDTNVVRGEGLFRELENPATFYYLHSFHLRPPERSSDWVSGTCSHGEEFVAAFEAGNLRGVQFHPEKSQGGGLTLLANFLRLSDAARVAKEGVAA